MEREQLFFIGIKQYLGKIKSLVISSRGNLSIQIRIKQICKKRLSNY